MRDRASSKVVIGMSATCVIMSLVLAAWFIAPVGAGDVAGSSLIGPTTWPRAMLMGVTLCAALILLRNSLVQSPAAPAQGVTSKPAEGDEFNNRKAALGVVLLILYVGAIALTGFALATLAFFLVWLPYGNVRRPVVVTAVAVIGTVALLYMFVKITTLPLNRGLGLFDALTVGLYRLLAIY